MLNIVVVRPIPSASAATDGESGPPDEHANAVADVADDRVHGGPPETWTGRHCRWFTGHAPLRAHGRPWPVRARLLDRSPASPSRASDTRTHTGSYVNGTCSPRSTEITSNINPADTGDVIASFRWPRPPTCAWPLMRCRGRRKTWKGRVLWRAADIARARIDEIARTLTREEGKILRKRAAKC